MIDKESKWKSECSAVGLKWLGKVDGARSRCECTVCGHVDEYVQAHIRRGNVKCSQCFEAKMCEECKAVGLTWIEKVDGRRSKCSCDVCGHVDEYDQGSIRAGSVKCSQCFENKMCEECKAVGLTWIEKVDGRRSKCSCDVCWHVDEYDQGSIRAGSVKCSQCHETKIRSECKAAGLTWLSKVDGIYTKCSCNVCGYIDEYQQANIRRGKVKCPNCQITKYKSSVKPGWTFINHICVDRITYINVKHQCCDDLVKVEIGNYLRGSYDCPHCMHSHFSDPSYFYVIQVGDMIKLGISNRPDQRYTQYGLPDDASIIEHLRIPLESKRDALVVESYAKQLVKDYKIPTEVSKQIFTESGCNECYSIDSLDHLLKI